MNYFSLLVLLSATFSCNYKSGKDTDLNKAQIRSDIRQMFTDYDLSVQKIGLIGEFDFLDESTDFFWVPPGYQSALTYDSVKSILTTNAKLFKSVQFEWQELQINPLSNRIANYTGLVKSTMVDTNNVETIVLILESGTVIKRFNGWKILSGQSRIKRIKNSKIQ